MLRLLECFKSITFVFSNDKNNTNIITFDEITTWIKSYNEWYMSITGMKDGNHLHLFYGRELEIIGNKPFLVNQQLGQIHNVCRECGFLLRLNIALCDLTVDNSTFLALLSEQSGVAINIYASQNIMKEETFPILENLASKNVLLSFVGSYSFWNELGVSSSQIVNKRLYQIIPVSSSQERCLLDTFNPCANRFRIFVDGNGWIYPCKGLMGIAECRIGTIYEDVSKIRILDTNYPFNLSSSEMRGPELVETSWIETENLSVAEPMPLVCGIHRIQTQHR